MKKLILFFVLAVAITGCRQNKEMKSADAPEQNADTIATTNANERWVWPDSVVDVLASTDSIISASDVPIDPKNVYTPEQKKLIKLMMVTYIDNVAFEGDSIYLNISRADFVSKGIPEPYYDRFLQDLKDLNTFSLNNPEVKGKMKELWEAQSEMMRREFENYD